MTMSFLTVPLKNHESRVIGVMQLINAKDESGKVVAFDEATLPLVEALASQAAVSIDNRPPCGLTLPDIRQRQCHEIFRIASCIHVVAPMSFSVIPVDPRDAMHTRIGPRRDRRPTRRLPELVDL